MLKNSKSSISRRAFIGGASLAGVSALALGSLVGCQPNAMPDTGSDASSSANVSGSDSEASVWDIEPLGEPTETITTKLCIVGAGGTGLAAGIQARQLGLEDVLVIEKQPMTGGSFIGSEGLFAVGSHYQLEAGAHATSAELIAQCMNYHHWVPDYALYRVFFDKTASTIDWLEDLGVEFSHVQALGDSYPTWHIYKGSKHPGVEFMESMAAAAEKVNLQVECNLGGKQIILDDDGKVAGLLAKRSDGTVVKIECQAVIIGTGGYANNVELTSYLTGNPPDFFNVAGTPGRDADGIKMGYAAGGALAKSPGTIQVTGPSCRGSKWGKPVTAVTPQPLLWVNQDAQRYIGEDMTLKNFPFSGTAMLNQQKVFAICDQAMIDRYVSGEGLQVPVGVYALAGEKLDGIDDPDLDFYAEVESLMDDSVFTAATAEELAEKIGLDPQALAETIRAYNSYCETGVDLDFAKVPDRLVPVLEANGPLYAFDCQDNYPTTCGGLKVTTKVEVVGKDGNVIPGLYAGGCDTGGFFGDAYDVGIAAGSTASWAINSGRIAAESAAEYLA